MSAVVLFPVVGEVSFMLSSLTEYDFSLTTTKWSWKNSAGGIL